MQCKPISMPDLDPKAPDDLVTEEELRNGKKSDNGGSKNSDENDIIFKKGSIKKVPGGKFAEFHLSFKKKEFLKRGVDLTSDIDFRLNLLETGSGHVISPSDVTWRHNPDRDYVNAVANGDPWSRFYGKLGLNPSAKMTDKALRSIKSAFGTLTLPLAEKRDTFVIANFGGSNSDLKKRKKIHEFTLGALEAYLDLKNSYETSDYTKLLEKFEEKVSYVVFQDTDIDGHTFDDKDILYLHSWSILNGQNAWIFARATSFAHDADRIKRSVLNPGVSTLNLDMMSEPQADLLLEEVNNVIGPDYVVAVENRDIFKNTVPISRLVSEEEVILIGYLKIRPVGVVPSVPTETNDHMDSIWPNQLDSLLEEVMSMIGGEELAKALRPIKEFMLNFLNKPGYEALQNVAQVLFSLSSTYGMFHMYDKNWLLGLRKMIGFNREDAEAGYVLKRIRNELKMEPRKKIQKSAIDVDLNSPELSQTEFIDETARK